MDPYDSRERRMIKLKDLLTETINFGSAGDRALPVGYTKTKSLSGSEITKLKKKLKLHKDSPVRKGSRGQIVPPKLSEKEKHHIIYVMLKKTRDKNLKRGLGGIKKHWSKMSRAERMHLDRLARGEGTTGSRPMK